jgi:hypothetical protein
VYDMCKYAYTPTHHLVLLLVQAAFQALVDVIEDDAVLAQPVDALAEALVLLCIFVGQVCIHTDIHQPTMCKQPYHAPRPGPG